MKKLASVTLLGLLLSGVASRSVYAIVVLPQLMVSDNLGDSITVDANGLVTTGGTVGGLNFMGTYSVSAAGGAISITASLGAAGAGWNLTVNTGTSVQAPGIRPDMDLNYDAQSTGTNNILTVKFTDGNFGPYTGPLMVGVNGNSVSAGTAQYEVLVDPANAPFGGADVFDTGAQGPTITAMAFPNITGAFPFSVTQKVTLNQPTGGHTASGDAFAVVPEPSILLLLGTGLVGFGYLRRRQRS